MERQRSTARPLHFLSFLEQQLWRRLGRWQEEGGRPCLLQKTCKGTVEMCVKWRYATVPFAKNVQRHGRNVCKAEVCDRAFCKKRAKARSKCAWSGGVRPCLLQKTCKGTVEMCVKWRCATVLFAKNGQRHGQNVREVEVCDRAF